MWIPQIPTPRKASCSVQSTTVLTTFHRSLQEAKTCRCREMMHVWILFCKI
ncbi:hypothetical protein BAE44_0017282 [Dichanthelium oligosanthes]|uniref:Uncharacterized protein n=1 Tax=Dichanthelium oligosanthes TaxID=888268 RepID=A0A1E5V9B0_9POAL|nr:hypothetical protein BAE44_0017282 [Dichanthelium oligosanthes]